MRHERTDTNIPAFARLVKLLEQAAGSRAADALRAPFSLGNQQELASLFSEAGAPSASTDGRVTFHLSAHLVTAKKP